MPVEPKVVWAELCTPKSDRGLGSKVSSCLDGWTERGRGGTKSLEES